MTLPRLICGVLSGIVTLALAAPVDAQIYVSINENGNKRYGDTPVGGGAHAYATYAVPGAARTILATRPPVDDYTGQFDNLIERHATANGVRADLVRAVIQVESGFNPRARSPKGARGLMQLMPGTALDLGVANSYDPEDNIRGGVRYLRMLLDRYGKDETLALAAYNAGPEAVEKYGNVVPPYRETQNYVERVQNISPLSAAAAAVRSPITADRGPNGQLVLRDGAARAASSQAPAQVIRQGVRTLYKTVTINADGQPVARYSDTKPASGDFEVYSYRR
jgi:hypothetical protein